jgi:hypothetical protein
MLDRRALAATLDRLASLPFAPLAQSRYGILTRLARHARTLLSFALHAPPALGASQVAISIGCSCMSIP